MNILFAADSGYQKRLQICIRSFLRFPSEEGYDIYIMHSDWTEEEQGRFQRQIGEGARVHFIYVDPQIFADFPDNKRYPKLIYYRIYAAHFLPKEMKRILYLDGDTIVINSLEELYNMDLEGYYYCACTHVKKVLNKINQIRLGTEEEYAYINSGVLLMNLELLRKEQKVDEIKEYVKERGMFFTLPDQDVITALYGEKIKIIDTLKYNLSDRILHIHNANLTKERIDLDWIRKNGVVIHYYGKNKPWDDSYFGKLDVFYHEVEKVK